MSTISKLYGSGVPTRTADNGSEYTDIQNGNKYIRKDDAWQGLLVENTGKVRIKNNGTYTYYADYTTALNAAVAGQQVEQCDHIVELNNVELILKDGVNIMGNGYSYTLNTIGPANGFYDNGVQVTCRIANLKVNRLNGSNNVADSTCIKIRGNNSFIDGRGSTCNNPNGTGIYAYPSSLGSGKLIGFTVTAYGQGILSAYRLIDCNATSNTTYGIHSVGGANNCFAQNLSGSDPAFFNELGTASNCSAHSLTSYGFYNQVGAESINCVGSSQGLDGFRNYGVANGCRGYSTAGVGFWSVTSPASNCSGYSTVTWGMLASSGAKLYNCDAVSTSYQAGFIDSGAYNCSFISLWNNAGGSGVGLNGITGIEIFGCHFSVVNAAAVGIAGNAGNGAKYGNNTMHGGASITTAGIIQEQTIAPDSNGNIKIG